MSAPSRSDLRYFRYKRVLEWAAQQSSFQITDAKAAIAEEQPGFVTRVIHELEAGGHLVRESSQSTDYRWNPGVPFVTEAWIDDKLFGSQIKESPEQDRPRERLLALGAEQLTEAELMAILIRSGRPGESAVMAGRRLSQAFDQRLQDLPDAGRAELKSISPAVEKTAYCQIMAGIELGRRVARLSEQPRQTRIGSSSDAIEFCQRRFARLASDSRREEFHIVTLDTKNQVIDVHQVSIGTLDASLVHPREVFRFAIRDAASSIILVHNHPSGDPTPSREDLAVTDRLTAVGEIVGIDVLDHIVVARHASVSIREIQ